MSNPIGYVLDTNILVHYVRSSEVWHRIRDRDQPFLIVPTPVICVVSNGELRSLARQWNWGEHKREQMRFCFEHFPSLPIEDDEILEAYAEIDSYSESIGRPMGKNDLWIAATAAATGATLVTTDRDFDHLTPQFLTRDWIDPNTP